ncbi:MAG: glycosyltransferase family 2 protein, partial [Candidatus Staskawiczbacteria bacterium]|nr:glycosyltransferase family 2 protein [Candidatus Staskawiczbacteria bacterium]
MAKISIYKQNNYKFNTNILRKLASMSLKVSVIIPIQNEELNISLIHQAVKSQLEKLGFLSYEILFIDDGSTDQTLAEIKKLSSDSHVFYIEFYRNFGKEMAVTAGLKNISGDAAIIIDADMQHPPELIPELIAKWRAGADMVIAVRSQNAKEGIIKKLGSAVFYKIMRAISEGNITVRGTDYRLIDRKVIDEYNHFTEHNRIARGLLD